MVKALRRSAAEKFVYMHMERAVEDCLLILTGTEGHRFRHHAFSIFLTCWAYRFPAATGWGHRMPAGEMCRGGRVLRSEGWVRLALPSQACLLHLKTVATEGAPAEALHR
jgi:hypothetical protein